MHSPHPAHDDLLIKINAAVKAANEAEMSVTTAQAELVSRSKVVGLLLLEAKKLHPQVKDFEAYLKRVNGLKLSRAYDLLRLAGGRTTDNELKKDARERQQKSRAKTKTPPRPAPEPKVSVTVTETAAENTQTEESRSRLAKRRRLAFGYDPSDPAARSPWNLDQFKYACRKYLPELNEADLKEAHAFVTCDEWRQAEKAA